MKNDLYLLYNKKYINNINDELLKLEIDLFVEKITELINEYHKNITEEKIIYKLACSPTSLEQSYLRSCLSGYSPQ